MNSFAGGDAKPMNLTATSHVQGIPEVATNFSPEEINSISNVQEIIMQGATASPNKLKRKRGCSRINKGLRYFSVKVCEKLSQTGVTSYNDIANLLVDESRVAETEAFSQGLKAYDEKNIRRRIYDALNVLMAMDIISKDNKEIRWRGINMTPINDCSQLVKKRTDILDRIEKKINFLQDLTLQMIGTRDTFVRNKILEEKSDAVEKLRAPFVIVSTLPTTDVECEMTNDRSTVFFDFADSFSINDDNVFFKDVGLKVAKKCKESNLADIELKFKQFLPAIYPDDVPQSLHIRSRFPWGEDGKLNIAPPTNLPPEVLELLAAEALEYAQQQALQLSKAFALLPQPSSLTDTVPIDPTTSVEYSQSEKLTAATQIPVQSVPTSQC